MFLYVKAFLEIDKFDTGSYGKTTFNSFMTEVPIIETSPLIFRANQWTGFYIIGTSVMKELIEFLSIIKFHSNAPNKRLLYTLLHWRFSICCDFKIFHLEIDNLKIILRKNNYPPNFIDFRIKSFLNRFYTYRKIPLICPPYISAPPNIRPQNM